MFISFSDIYSFILTQFLFNFTQNLCLGCFWEGHNFGVQQIVSETQTIKDWNLNFIRLILCCLS